MLARHQQANDFVVAKGETTVRKGRFEAALKLPTELPWRRLIVRAQVTTDRQEGIGVKIMKMSCRRRLEHAGICRRRHCFRYPEDWSLERKTARSVGQ